MAKRRTKGNGSIRKRGNSWQARITNPEGREISTTCATRREAEDWLTDIRADIQRGEYVAPSEISLAEWLADYFATYKQAVAPSTKRHYADCTNRLIEHTPELLDIPLQRITPTDLQQVVNALQAIYSPRSVRMSIGLVRSALKKAVALGMIRRNPADDLTLPAQVTIQGGKVLAPAEIQKLINYCKSPTQDPRSQVYKDIILFLLRHGCRPGEARAIRTDKIRDGWVLIDSALDQRQNIKDTKTHQARRIPIALDCLDMVDRRIASSRNGWLFEGAAGTPIGHRNLARHLAAVTDNLYSPYDLRHTFCTAAVSSGKNIKAISAITGHSVEMLLSVYVHVTDSDLVDVIQSHNGQITDKRRFC